MLNIIMVFFLASPVQAQVKKPSTHLYESDSDANSKDINFTAKVKVIRDDGDGVEVFFNSDKAKGAYSLPRSAAKFAETVKLLESSKKPGGAAVSVTADSEKRIKAVEKAAAAAAGGVKIPDDPNEKWDFGKVPD